MFACFFCLFVCLFFFSLFSWKNKFSGEFSSLRISKKKYKNFHKFLFSYGIQPQQQMFFFLRFFWNYLQKLLHGTPVKRIFHCSKLSQKLQVNATVTLKQNNVMNDFMIFKLTFLFKNLILLKRSFPWHFPIGSILFKLFFSVFEKYPWRKLFCNEIMSKPFDFTVST